MSLKLVATPIGDPGDITLRAIESLKTAEVVIGEERREVSTLLKKLGIENKELKLLNEHTTNEEVQELLGLCRTKDVALVTDCGTPGFCDPGARLVDVCRKAGVAVTSLPGASSLMSLLSLAALETREFYFAGFPPAEREARAAALKMYVQDPGAVVLMDTPYRLSKLLHELASLQPERRALLGMNLTSANEKVLEGSLANLAKQTEDAKAEFMLLLYSQSSANFSSPRRPIVKPIERPKSRSLPGKRFTPGRSKRRTDPRRKDER